MLSISMDSPSAYGNLPTSRSISILCVTYPPKAAFLPQLDFRRQAEKPLPSASAPSLFLSIRNAFNAPAAMGFAK